MLIVPLRKCSLMTTKLLIIVIVIFITQIFIIFFITKKIFKTRSINAVIIALFVLNISRMGDRDTVRTLQFNSA